MGAARPQSNQGRERAIHPRSDRKATPEVTFHARPRISTHCTTLSVVLNPSGWMNTSKNCERESVAQQPTPLEGLLGEHAVAKFYGVSVATVRRWRWLGTGPKFYKLGASVRYRMADLEAYLRSTRTGGGS
ncbi:MAG: helix-turn-helix transcriptional regulator [Bryobacteraceae bacterium]